MGLLVVRLYYHKSKKNFSMVQKSSVKKDALLPWSQRGRVVRVFYAFSSVASSAASVTCREEEEELHNDEGVGQTAVLRHVMLRGPKILFPFTYMGKETSITLWIVFLNVQTSAK